MPEYILVGDITHPGLVVASGRDLDEAVEHAEAGEFKVWNEANKHLIFEFCGGTDGGAEVLDDEA